MKRLAKRIIALIGSVLGLSIHIQIKREHKSDLVLIDKYIFSPFLNNEWECQLYREALKKSDATWSDNFYKQCRYYSLSQIANIASTRFPNSDIVECGVWKGHSAWMIAKIFSNNEFGGQFHIFDSFEGGLSNKEVQDKNLIRNMTTEEIKNEKESFYSRESQVAKVLSEFSFIRLYAGWIPERFNDMPNRLVSFVHIDVDLYQPTLDSLNYFWERLVEGGYIVVDDFGSSQFPGATTAVEEFLKKHKPSFYYKVPMGSCFICK